MKQRVRSEKRAQGSDEGDKENRRDTPGGQGGSDVDVGMLLGESRFDVLCVLSTDARYHRSQFTSTITAAHSYLPPLDKPISEAQHTVPDTPAHLGYRLGRH